MALKKGTVLKNAFDTYTIQKHRGAGGSGVVYGVLDVEKLSLPKGGVVVQDQMQIQVGGHIVLDSIEKRAEFGAAVATMQRPDDLCRFGHRERQTGWWCRGADNRGRGVRPLRDAWVTAAPCAPAPGVRLFSSTHNTRARSGGVPPAARAHGSNSTFTRSRSRDRRPTRRFLGLLCIGPAVCLPRVCRPI